MAIKQTTTKLDRPVRDMSAGALADARHPLPFSPALLCLPPSYRGNAGVLGAMPRTLSLYALFQ